MSQGDFVKIDDFKQVLKIAEVTKRIEDWDYSTPLCVFLKPYSDPRTVSQNALFHAWCRDMSNHFIEKVPSATEENIKLMMKQRFLGVEDIRIGKTVIEGQVKRTSNLSKGEMVHFLDNVYHWARENKCLLTVPKDSEYQKLLNQQEK